MRGGGKGLGREWRRWRKRHVIGEIRGERE